MCQADLIISARREERLRELADSLDVRCDIVVADLGDPAGAASLIEQVEALDVPVDILVNNAGIATNNAFVDTDQADIDNMMTLNMMALTRLTRHFAGLMATRGVGRVLNVASVAGFQPVPSMSLYAATKAFVISLTEGLSEELRDRGVYLTALCPGLTKTEMVDDLPNASALPPMAVSTAEEVAREGFDAVMTREVIRIPGILNQAAVTWAQHQPRWVVRSLGGLFGRLSAPR